MMASLARSLPRGLTLPLAAVFVVAIGYGVVLPLLPFMLARLIPALAYLFSFGAGAQQGLAFGNVVLDYRRCAHPWRSVGSPRTCGTEASARGSEVKAPRQNNIITRDRQPLLLPHSYMNAA